MQKFVRTKRFWSLVAVAATIAFNAISGNKVSSEVKSIVTSVVKSFTSSMAE